MQLLFLHLAKNQYGKRCCQVKVGSKQALSLPVHLGRRRSGPLEQS